MIHVGLGICWVHNSAPNHVLLYRRRKMWRDVLQGNSSMERSLFLDSKTTTGFGLREHDLSAYPLFWVTGPHNGPGNCNSGSSMSALDSMRHAATSTLQVKNLKKGWCQHQQQASSHFTAHTTMRDCKW